MPVLHWRKRDSGDHWNRVWTTRKSMFGAEEHRPAAEAFDREIDDMLDRAVKLTESVEAGTAGERDFIRRWSLGRALRASQLQKSDNFEPDEDKILWEALSIKCQNGIRSSGKHEPRWRDLIPERDSAPQRIERDVFAGGLWLQEQDLTDASLTFGASLTNARGLHRRHAVSNINLRTALHQWLKTYDETSRRTLTRTKNFETMAKALAKRWPGRGPGSAKQPVHYEQDVLNDELRRVLVPLAAELLADAPPQ